LAKVLEWDVLLKICETDSKLIMKNYWKGDYDHITEKLLKINGKEQLNEKTVKEMWAVYKLELLKQTEEYIPLKKEYKPKKRTIFPKQLESTWRRSEAWKKYFSYFHQEKIFRSIRRLELK